MTETKISQALLKKKMEQAVSQKPITFEKILLKFDKLRKVLGYIKSLFGEVAKEGKLDHDGLQDAMKRLHVDMTLEEILDLFDFVNVQERDGITIKEFLVALTIGMVLDVIPALLSPSGKLGNAGTVGEIRPSIDHTFSGFMGHHAGMAYKTHKTHLIYCLLMHIPNILLSFNASTYCATTHTTSRDPGAAESDSHGLPDLRSRRQGLHRAQGH
jgi:hypothetical protein